MHRNDTINTQLIFTKCTHKNIDILHLFLNKHQTLSHGVVTHILASLQVKLRIHFKILILT